MKQFACLVGLLSGVMFQASAQITPSSLNQDPDRARYLTAGKPASQQKASAVTLPFFDDFASYEGLPSTQWWLPEGGVLINNRFGDKPISKNVATFDGVKADGTEYTFSGTNVTGLRDTLTSTVILLNTTNPQDSVYLSFYWQAGGNSIEFPAAGNSHHLRLEFKNNAGNWDTIWTQIGQNTSSAFNLKLQPIKDAKYFHPDFQFRFISSGQKGLRGIWNIDYVLLDKNRSKSAPYANTLVNQDVAVSRPIRSLLKRYTGMPYHQFFANPGQELSDSVFTTASNLNKQIPAPIEKKGELRNLVTNQNNRYLDQTEIVPADARNFVLNGTPNQTVISNRNAFISIENKMFIDNKEGNPATRYNDTISRVTDLHDYFAYDDGSAETGFSLARTGTRYGAYRYVANQPDKVRSFRVFLTGANNPGTVATFRIWNDNNGQPDGTGKHVHTFIVPTTPLNRWVEIQFDSAVSVSGTFYAGWGLAASVQQFFNIGYDLNEAGNNHFVYRDSNFPSANWFTYNSPGDLRGAVMLRPVLERSHIMAAPDQPAALAIHIYPNPSTGTIQLSADWPQVTIFNLVGSVVGSYQNITAGQPLQLGHLPKGMYLVKLQKGNTVITRKLLLN